jgi:hypothetical protein
LRREGPAKGLCPFSADEPAIAEEVRAAGPGDSATPYGAQSGHWFGTNGRYRTWGVTGVALSVRVKS